MLYVLSGNSYELTNYLLDELNDNNIRIIKACDLREYRNSFVKHIARIAYIFKIPFSNVFSKKTKSFLKEIKESDSVLLWGITSPPLVYAIKRIIVSEKIHLWLWNTIGDDSNKIILIKKIINSIYTFDRDDAVKYNLKFKNQICYDYTKYKVNTLKEKKDIYFVGTDKGRFELLENLYNLFTEKGFSCDFHIIPDSSTNREYPKNLLSTPLSFIENIEHIVNCNCILELVKDGQVGLTMRALEAICAQKKLITNNKDIVNYDFYNKDYIFVLNKDNYDNIEAFINTTNICYSTDRNKFFIENWIKEFI